MLPMLTCLNTSIKLAIICWKVLYRGSEDFTVASKLVTMLSEDGSKCMDGCISLYLEWLLKGIPASVQIFEREKLDQAQPVARRSFFKCSTAQLIWNRGSTGLLVIAQSDVDKSNQSYYGESRLHYLTTDGSHEGMVPLRKEGPVHDVQWSPLGSEFAVVYGFMPASVTLFDKKCNPLLEFGAGPYNTLRWNPHGKLLCIAGFGNLPGDMVFWDCPAKKLLGSTRAEWSVTSEWSPDGQYFMTATTAPRLQIDNGMKIFSYNGSLYFKKMFERLYQAEWRPAQASAYGDLPELVEQVKESLSIDKSNAATKTSNPQPKSSVNPAKPAASTKPAVPAKPAAYRPPHSKGDAAINAQVHASGLGIQTGSQALRHGLGKEKTQKPKDKRKVKNKTPEQLEEKRIKKLKRMQKLRAGQGTSAISNVANVLENWDEIHNENVENNDFAMNNDIELNDNVGMDEEIDMNPIVEPLLENPNVNPEICMKTLNEERHGKGEHDGAGACVKRALAREELKFKDGAKFTDAKNIVDWCVKNMGHESQERSMHNERTWMEMEKTTRVFCRGPQHGGLRSDETSLGATESEKSPVEDMACLGLKALKRLRPDEVSESTGSVGNQKNPPLVFTRPP
ncbi:hypothetical protein KI387_011902 [Taxus chinensis]|uniref:Eukaryotic translation initiation factor 2A n=1 Tax=Taxus chinensis TaxID=29808 RepID=A0AA38CNZ6_TAXCH|nr:hypothetical protein KI387_011902 [Taxus chinensis]